MEHPPDYQHLTLIIKSSSNMLQNLGAIQLEPLEPTASKPGRSLARNDDLQPLAAPIITASEPNDLVLNKSRSIIVIAILTLVLAVNSVSTGLLTVGIPRIAADLNLSESLLLWPQSVYGLTSGSCLLLAGSVADVIGSRIVNLAGTFLLGCFILACGLPRTGIELILFRAMQGIAVALCLPTGMGILSTAIPSGTRRNIAFSCLGGGQVLGFAVGLVLSGVLLDTIGWRAGYYISGAVTLALFVVSVWALPADQGLGTPILRRLAKDVDGVGAAMASCCLAMLSYVLA